MKNKSEKAITLVALVITIIILLILAGITLATLTGENGLIKRAIEAREKTRYEIAEEKVKLAVNASYGESGNLEKEELKENINKIEGLHEQIIGDISYDLTIKVDGYEFKITELGQVIYVGKKEEESEEEKIKKEIDKIISIIEEQASENREKMEIDELIKKIEDVLKDNDYIVKDEKVILGEIEIPIVDHIGEIYTRKINIQSPKNSITTIKIGEKEIGKITQSGTSQEGKIEVRTKDEKQQIKVQCILNGEVIYEKEFDISEINNIKMYPCEENNDGKALYWYGMEFTNFKSGAVQYNNNLVMSGGTCTKNANNINLNMIDNSAQVACGIGLNCYEDLTNYNNLEIEIGNVKYTGYAKYQNVVGDVANNYYYSDVSNMFEGITEEVTHTELNISNISGKKYISILNYNPAGSQNTAQNRGSCSIDINKIVLKK